MVIPMCIDHGPLLTMFAQSPASSAHKPSILEGLDTPREDPPEAFLP